MASRNERLSELGKVNPIGALDHRLLKNEKGEIPLFESMSRKERRDLEAGSRVIRKEYEKKIRDLISSGAKFPSDVLLREMAVEYTNRYANSGIFTQPINFNYFEPFLRIGLINGVAPFVAVLHEFNHLFFMEDFFDYVTSSDSDGFDVSSLLKIPQNHIFHFSVSGLVTDFPFFSDEGREFIVSGFSIVRNLNSINWYLIGGEGFSEDEWNKREDRGGV